MENEIWKNIAGYEQLYQVSSFGRVKSLKHGKEKILKPGLTGGNYLDVILCKNKTCKHFLIHRLVAAAFIPNPQNLPEINHKSEIKSNNRVDNLEWCDRRYNVNYGTAQKRRAESRSLKVDQYTLAGEFVRTWPSAMQAERDLGIASSSVYKCCKGIRKSAAKFVWRYNLEQNVIQKNLEKEEL